VAGAIVAAGGPVLREHPLMIRWKWNCFIQGPIWMLLAGLAPGICNRGSATAAGEALHHSAVEKMRACFVVAQNRVRDDQKLQICLGAN